MGVPGSTMVESGLTVMMWPTKLLVSTLVTTLRAQQQLWAGVTRVARGGSRS